MSHHIKLSNILVKAQHWTYLVFTPQEFSLFVESPVVSYRILCLILKFLEEFIHFLAAAGIAYAILRPSPLPFVMTEEDCARN